MIAQILSPVQVRGNVACLTWSRCHNAMHWKSFGIDWYAWQNPTMMWLCIGVVWFLSDKMWILNWIKLWKIHENPSTVVACWSKQLVINCRLDAMHKEVKDIGDGFEIITARWWDTPMVVDRGIWDGSCNVTVCLAWDAVMDLVNYL